MPFLKQWFNGNALNVYEFEQSLSIGRAPECSLVIEDPTISSVHAVIEVDDLGCRVKDQNSTNGVLMAGEKITEVKLSHGQRFSLGTCEFEFLDSLPSEFESTLKIKKSWIPGVYYTKK